MSGLKRAFSAEHEHSGTLVNVASSLKFENAQSAGAPREITDPTQPTPSIHLALQFAHLELSRLFRAAWWFGWLSRGMYICGTLSDPVTARTLTSLSSARCNPGCPTRLRVTLSPKSSDIPHLIRVSSCRRPSPQPPEDFPVCHAQFSKALMTCWEEHCILVHFIGSILVECVRPLLPAICHCLPVFTSPIP